MAIKQQHTPYAECREAITFFRTTHLSKHVRTLVRSTDLGRAFTSIVASVFYDGLLNAQLHSTNEAVVGRSRNEHRVATATSSLPYLSPKLLQST